MNRVRRALRGALCWLAGAAAWAPAAGDETAMRAPLAAERRAIEARHAQSEHGCATRFAVNDCLETARAQRRASLADLGQREAALNDAERVRRAALRLERIDAKRARQAADLAERASAPRLPLPAASATTRSRPEPTPRPIAPAEPRGVDAEQRRIEGQRAREAQASRQQQAEQRKRVVEERALQRRASGKPAVPPLPPASSPG